MSGISKDDVAAAQARLDALAKERELTEKVVRLGRVSSLEDFERLSGEERTTFYREQPDEYARFLNEKADIWRRRLLRGDAHAEAVREALRGK